MPPILVVDDDPSFQALITGLFDITGTDVVTARTAYEGLQLARDVRPILILMDIRLPGTGIDSWEAIRQIKADAALSHIPVIVVTAAHEHVNEQEALEMGCEAVFKKPFHIQEFRDWVLRYL